MSRKPQLHAPVDRGLCERRCKTIRMNGRHKSACSLETGARRREGIEENVGLRYLDLPPNLPLSRIPFYHSPPLRISLLVEPWLIQNLPLTGARHRPIRIILIHRSSSFFFFFFFRVRVSIGPVCGAHVPHTRRPVPCAFVRVHRK